MMQPQSYRVNLNWRDAIEGVPISYANQFMVQYVGDEFIISVGQASPPGLVAPTREQIAEITTITPTIVFRFAVSASSMRSLMQVIVEQLEAHESGVLTADQPTEAEQEDQ